LKGGGGSRTIPQYKVPEKFSPYLTNLQKQKQKQIQDRKDEKSGESNKPRQQQQQQQHQQQQNKPIQSGSMKPIVNLQVYDTEKPAKEKKKQQEPYIIYPSTTHPFYPPQFQQQYFGHQQPQIVKKYNINASGPMVNHNIISRVYEDMLPTKFYENTYMTIGERKSLYEFIRSVFIKIEDGEQISLTGGNGTKDERTLLSYIKFVDMNPYGNKNNPYDNTPCADMLLYKSCYPIRIDRSSGTVKCAKDSVGINIRVYFMTNGERYFDRIDSMKDGKVNPNANKYEYDIWREISIYGYIRDYIVKKMVCPNFMIMYGYYLCDDSKLNPPAVGIRNNRTSKKIAGKPFIEGKFGGLKMMKIGADKHLNEDAYSGSVLIALTESPTYGLKEWASTSRVDRGTKHEMINHGYHEFKVWKSVIFQLIAGLYVLQKNCIRIVGLDINNIFIKDVNNKSGETFWRYKVDGVDYYVPNYGFLVMIDSNFKDNEQIEDKYKYVGTPDKDYKKYRIETYIFDKDKTNKSAIEEDVFNDFKEIICPNVFGPGSKNEGMIIPEDVMVLIDLIHQEANKNAQIKIDYYLHNYMMEYTHSRVGTPLSKDERETLDLNVNVSQGNRIFSKGDIVVKDNRFVLAIEEAGTSTTKIITKNDKDEYMVIDAANGSLRPYPNKKQLEHTFRVGQENIGVSNIIETYTM